MRDPERPSRGDGVEWSSDRIRALLDVAPDGVLIIDHDETIVHVNPVALEHLGIPRDDLIGLSAAEFLAAFEGTAVPEHYHRLRHHGGNVEFEEYIPALDGWYRFFADADALGGGMIVVFVREVTGHRLVVRRAQLLAAISEAVEQTRTMGDTLRAVLAVVRTELGFDLGELWVSGIDRPRLLAIDHDDDREDLDALVDDWVTAHGQSSVATHGQLPRWAGLDASAEITIPVEADHPLRLRLLRRQPLSADDSVSVVHACAGALANILNQRRAQLEVEQFFELTREYVVIMTAEGRLRRVNPVVVENLGFGSPSELVGSSLEEFVHPDDIGPTLANLEVSLTTGEPIERFVQRVRIEDGSYRWISWNAQGSLEEQMIFGTGRDVSDERADRLARQAIDSALRGVLAGEPITLTLQRLADVVAAFERVVGCAVALVRGDESAPDQHVLEVVAAPALPPAFVATFDGRHPADAPGEIGAVLGTGEPAITTRLSADPRWSPADAVADCGFESVRTLPLLGADDRVLGVLLVATSTSESSEGIRWDRVHEVVSLAGLAVESARSVAALAANEERFRIIAEVITDAVFERSSDGCWTTDAFTSLFGHEVPPGGVADDWWLERVHREDRDDVRSSLLAAIEEGAGTWEIEYRFLRGDGGIADVRVRGRLLRDGAGHVTSLIGGMLDVSERRELERQYLRALRVESLGTLAGGIAHDLNNSLAPIVMGAELLADLDLEPDALDILETVAAAARRSAGMVRNILTYARGAETPRGLMELDEVVSSVVKMLVDTFPKHIEVLPPSGASGFVVRGDPTQIHQIVMNLALNARDAMPTGGVLRVSVDAVDDPPTGGPEDHDGSLAGLGVGSFARVRVADSGTGMSAAIRERVFEPFFTTKTRSEGTGLGLPTALSIARGHGGGLAVSTRPGAGTTVDLYLPLVDRSVTNAFFDAPAVDSADADALGGASLTVLVVDDEQAIRAMLRQMLESLGHQVVEAADGGEAVMAVSEQDVDLLVTDVMMPGIDGVQLVEFLRGAGVDIPIVAMTGLTDDGRSLQFPDGSISAMLAKPFDRSALVAALAAAVRP